MVMRACVVAITVLLAGCGHPPVAAGPAPLRAHTATAAQAQPAASGAATPGKGGAVELRDHDLWDNFPAHAAWLPGRVADGDVLIAVFSDSAHPFQGGEVGELPLVSGDKVAFRSPLILGRDGMVYAERIDDLATRTFFQIGRYATTDLEVSEGSGVKVQLSSSNTFMDLPAISVEKPGGLMIQVNATPPRVASPRLVQRRAAAAAG